MKLTVGVSGTKMSIKLGGKWNATSTKYTTAIHVDHCDRRITSTLEADEDVRIMFDSEFYILIVRARDIVPLLWFEK